MTTAVVLDGGSIAVPIHLCANIANEPATYVKVFGCYGCNCNNTPSRKAYRIAKARRKREVLARPQRQVVA
jgi:hypothetical protein